MVAVPEVFFSRTLIEPHDMITASVSGNFSLPIASILKDVYSECKIQQVQYSTCILSLNQGRTGIDRRLISKRGAIHVSLAFCATCPRAGSVESQASRSLRENMKCNASITTVPSTALHYTARWGLSTVFNRPAYRSVVKR